MSLISKILEYEKSIKDIGVKIANASKKRSPDLENLETKKASMESDLEKLVKQSNFGEGTDFTDSAIPGEVDYDANANDSTGAPMETEASDEGFDEAAPVEDTGMESAGSVSDEIMNSLADIIEEKASEGLSVEELVEALRSGDTPEDAEDFDMDETPEDASEFTEDEDDMDFDDGEEDMEEIPEMGGESEQLPSNDKFKFASLKCNKCGSTSFIKKNNKFACQHCKELISDLTGLPIDVLELISPKLRDEAAMENEMPGEIGEEMSPMEDEGIVGVEIEAEPIEEMEDEFPEEEFEESSELPEEADELEIENEGSEDEEADELLEEHEESESPEEEMEEEESGEDEEEEKEDLLEEHESEESPEEEHEEEESPEEESEEHEPYSYESAEDDHIKGAEVIYKAKLVKKSNKDQTYWLIFGNDTPLFKVSASYAWKDVDAVPAANDFPVKFASYYDAFTSPLYRDSIIEHCTTAGYKTCCNLANGRLLKSAQTFGNNPLQGNAVGENPVPNTNNNNAPGGLGADTLNPDAETEAMFNEDEPAKILITDIIVNWLAPEIANGTYNLEEIMTELKATFSDEAAISEFEGQLREKADNFSDKKDNEPLGTEEETPAGDMGLGLGAPMAPAGQNTPPTGGAADLSNPIKQASKKVSAKKPCCDTCKKEPCTCKEDEANEKLAAKDKEMAVRYKIAQARKYVQDEMQTRGFNGIPLVETVDYLVSQGTNQTEAEQLVKNAVNEKIRTIVKMSDEQFASYSELLEKTPKMPAREEAEAFEKFASVMANDSTALPYMPNKELKSGVDAILDDDLFNNSRISDLADAHSRNRRNTKYIG